MRRIQLGPVIRRLIRDAATRLPEFAHIRASRILVVAGEARRASRATIRPLGTRGPRGRVSATGRVRPLVRFQGRRVLYVITLRPRFFRLSTPEARIETLLHELFHISRRFDGTLHAGRRHSALPGPLFARRLRPLVRRYLRVIPPDLLAGMSHDGELLVRQWLDKPPLWLPRDRRGRRRYDEGQLYLGPVMMVTRKRR